MVPKEDEPETDAKQSHAKVSRVEPSTYAESSRDGHNLTREVDRLLKDVRENVATSSSECRQRRSPKTYTGYMVLSGKCVKTKQSSFEEVVQKPIWVDGMVEVYVRIFRHIGYS